MLACYAHVEDDSNPQRSGRPAPHAQGARRDGGYVALRLPLVRDADARGPPDIARVPGAVAPARASQGAQVCSRHHPGGPGRRVIVLDASVIVDLLIRAPGAEAIERRLARDRSLHAPALLDLEVAHVIRRYCAERQLPVRRAHEA